MIIQEEKLDKLLCREILYLLDSSKKEAYDEDYILHKKMKTDDFKNSNVDFDYYLYSASLGKFHITTVRNEKNKLVGYFSLIITQHTQCKDVRIATNQSITIHKDYRNYKLVKNLINYTESKLKEKGVDLIHIGIQKSNSSLCKLINRFGYKEEEVLFIKEINKEES